MEQVFRLGDELGPVKIVHLWEAALGMRAILVIDNIAAGPSIGGVRMASDVSLEECFRLARAMTLKNAAAGLAHGGGKSVIFGDPHMPLEHKERWVRAFAAGVRNETGYILGPDMGTDEHCMAWSIDEGARAVGLPAEIGGIPLDEIGATGFGLAVCAEVAREFCALELDGARVAVQGYGSVGRHAARFLAEKGAILVAAADSKGTLVDTRGLDLTELDELKRAGRSVLDARRGEKLPSEAVIDVECEVWIPAARPDVIRADNVERLRTRLVLQGANIPVSADAEEALHRRGVLAIPDFIANAGGVICGAVELHDGTQKQAFETIEERILRNTREVLEEATRDGVTPRRSALALAERRVRSADRLRRFGPRP